MLLSTSHRTTTTVMEPAPAVRARGRVQACCLRTAPTSKHAPLQTGDYVFNILMWNQRLLYERAAEEGPAKSVKDRFKGLLSW